MVHSNHKDETWVEDSPVVLVYPVAKHMDEYLSCGEGLVEADGKMTTSLKTNDLKCILPYLTDSVTNECSSIRRHTISHNVTTRDLFSLSPRQKMTDPCVNVWLDW